MPLSKVLEWMMEFTAMRMSAVSSMMTGVLPGPTPNAGLPELYAAATMPGPPVARMMSEERMTVLVSSSDGTSIHAMMFLGQPARSAASRTMRAASMVQPFARGCGLITMALRVLSARRHLKMAVEVGLVVGMTAATMPMGSATWRMP